MSVTGVSDFNLDLAEIVEEAFERCGSELRTGYDLRTARRSLNLLFADWSNRGVNMWTFEQGQIPLVQGVSTYALPNDTGACHSYSSKCAEQSSRPNNNQNLCINIRYAAKQVTASQTNSGLDTALR